MRFEISQRLYGYLDSNGELPSALSRDFYQFTEVQTVSFPRWLWWKLTGKWTGR